MVSVTLYGQRPSVDCFSILGIPLRNSQDVRGSKILAVTCQGKINKTRGLDRFRGGRGSGRGRYYPEMGWGKRVNGPGRQMLCPPGIRTALRSAFPGPQVVPSPAWLPHPHDFLPICLNLLAGCAKAPLPRRLLGPYRLPLDAVPPLCQGRFKKPKTGPRSTRL